jgi:hypothetical protein
MIAVLLLVLALYLIAGFLFALAFVSRGCGRIDRDAAEAGPGFRMIIFPASTVLWPLLLKKWIKAAGQREEL